MFKPAYRLTKHLSIALERTAVLSSALDRLSSASPLRISVTREALNRDVHSSTWIEGNDLSLEQVAALAAGKDVAAEGRQKLEVKNCLAALRWVFRHKAEAMTARRVLGLHARMTRGLLPPDRSGHWRTVQNYVINARRQVIFTPPSPEHVPGRVRELLSWLNKSSPEHAIAQSAIFHHEFVAIHPFVDGNGRMARALSQWVLIRGGYDPAHALGLDEYFASDRAKYYQMIQETHDMDNDYTHWIEYVASGLLKSMEDLAERLRSEEKWTPRQRELLGLIKSGGVMSSADLCRAMKINRARVNQLITPLIAGGFVVREGQTRSARYRAV